MLGEAILLALEAKARVVDLDGTLSDHRAQAIFDALDQLRAVGILEDTAPMPAALTTPAHDDPAPWLAAETVQEVITGLDRILATAARYEPQPGERPRQRGLPVLSKHGHPSSLARVTDPASPFGDTAADLERRRRDHRAAEQLVTVVRRTWRTALKEAEQTMDTLPLDIAA
ncbi:hypothetical protein [Nesterenkonia flava]|uniref:Uncharacterized protein n=1 Tax=Nesterenkonia flava TaxID=469799 RepID=A0ABU1FWT8_9MICC|nr:hypothetical protein [Nesterenkonia flava]MDR5712935.1 hypothetical protein [Nesterenkonia flava]